jgi:fatty acid desaturase
MKKQPIQSATALPPSPDAERRSRMRKYTIAMSVRLVCFLAAIFIWYWSPVWAIALLVGAAVLPYVAVVLANTVVQPRVTPVERPGGLVPVSRPHSDGDS